MSNVNLTLNSEADHFHGLWYMNSTIISIFTKNNPANMQDRANVGHQLAGLAKRRQICQRFANVANVLPTSLQTP